MVKSIIKAILPRTARLLLRKVFYFGFRFKCNVCGNHVRQLLPVGSKYPVLEELQVIGGKYRPEDGCPICFSDSRTRLVHHYLLEASNLKSSQPRLLHVAPEFGIYLLIRKFGNIDYVPADLDPGRYTYGMPIDQIDVTQIEHSSNSFGAIICNHVLEHIENDRLAMAELFRVLEPGGWAILQVPISKKLVQTLEDPNIVDSSQREHYFGQRDHVRIYAMDYVERLESIGFSVKVFDPLVHWGRETTEKLRLAPEEKIFVAHKKKTDNFHK